TVLAPGDVRQFAAPPGEADGLAEIARGAGCPLRVGGARPARRAAPDVRLPLRVRERQPVHGAAQGSLRAPPRDRRARRPSGRRRSAAVRAESGPPDEGIRGGSAVDLVAAAQAARVGAQGARLRRRAAAESEKAEEEKILMARERRRALPDGTLRGGSKGPSQ